MRYTIQRPSSSFTRPCLWLCGPCFECFDCGDNSYYIQDVIFKWCLNFHASLYLYCYWATRVYYNPQWIWISASSTHCRTASVTSICRDLMFLSRQRWSRCREFDEEFKSPLSGWGVSRDFLPSKLWRLTPAPLITHCSPGLRLMNKQRD